MNVYDKEGIPILPGDTLKVFHFTGSRGKKFYMYKYVKELRSCNGKYLLEVMHLSLDGASYWMSLDDRIHADIEIVQGYGGVEKGQSFMDRKKKGVAK
jgi:hypothetical protein